VAPVTPARLLTSPFTAKAVKRSRNLGDLWPPLLCSPEVTAIRFDIFPYYFFLKKKYWWFAASFRRRQCGLDCCCLAPDHGHLRFHSLLARVKCWRRWGIPGFPHQRPGASSCILFLISLFSFFLIKRHTVPLFAICLLPEILERFPPRNGINLADLNYLFRRISFLLQCTSAIIWGC